MTRKRVVEERGSRGGDDKRRQAVENCDACGVRALCTRQACPHCGLLYSTCGACDKETGGQALGWQVAGHVRRAHSLVSIMQQAKRDEVQHRRRLHRSLGERHVVRNDEATS